MIRFPADINSLPAPERFGLELLVDLARLLPVADPNCPAVTLALSDRTGPDASDLQNPSFGVADGTVTLSPGLLRTVVEIAGGGVEQLARDQDRHSRVPTGQNPLAADGLERVPVVSIAARALADAVVAAGRQRPIRFLAPWPDRRRWAVAISHDLDVVDWWPAFTALRLAELIRRGELRRAGRTLGAALAATLRDPAREGVTTLLDLEREMGITSTWFILAGTPSVRSMVAGDLTYRLESTRARSFLDAIRSDSHEIGLHGSFATMDDSAVLEAERERLAHLTGSSPAGVRQHYLRMRPGRTHRAMRLAGFEYDATYGFPDRNGFRLGVADVVPGWDELGRCPSGLDEVPLIWMDRALSKYRGEESPAKWIEDALALAETCRGREGLWVGLWHPNLVPALGFPDATDALCRLLAGLLAEHPYVASIGRLVAWRRARRGVRAMALGSDGMVQLSGPPSTEPEVVLEDEHRRVVQVSLWPARR